MTKEKSLEILCEETQLERNEDLLFLIEIFLDFDPAYGTNPPYLD